SSAEIIGKLPFDVASKSTDELSTVSGIGKSTALKIQELIQNGTIAELAALEAQTSAGVLELLKIKGLGPKKIALIWNELGIDTIPEIWYACKANKIAGLKGFGAKTQADLQNLLEFTIENQGKHRFADIEPVAEDVLALARQHSNVPVPFTGRYRRLICLREEIYLLLAAGSDDIKNGPLQAAYSQKRKRRMKPWSISMKADCAWCSTPAASRISMPGSSVRPAPKGTWRQ